ncbi:hypothetical protein HPB52_021649 [Rhipicephalus sanguineus]|uniref:Uncharacterized protein n=1 Tax=Rhipicephalus sanguineus TaxID=34632 RepID=A0A9D4Q367_RHISA|nr:hypothetical protein HPB52_021649 [Rhipicephalus sanguineus]
MKSCHVQQSTIIWYMRHRLWSTAQPHCEGHRAFQLAAMIDALSARHLVDARCIAVVYGTSRPTTQGKTIFSSSKNNHAPRFGQLSQFARPSEQPHDLPRPMHIPPNIIDHAPSGTTPRQLKFDAAIASSGSRFTLSAASHRAHSPPQMYTRRQNKSGHASDDRNQIKLHRHAI